MKRFILLLSVIGMTIFFANALYAGTQTASLNVSATAVAACSVSVTDVNFGNYVGDYQYASGNVEVTCSPGVTYYIALDAGQHSLGTDAGRQMSNGEVPPEFIGYELQSQPGIPWGDEGYGDTYLASPVQDLGNGAAQNHEVIATAYAAAVPAGSYSDVVQVTVNY